MLRRWVALPVSSRCCGMPSLSTWAVLLHPLLMSASRRPLKGTCVAGPCCVDGCIRRCRSKLQKFKIAMSWQTGILPAGPPHHVLRSHSADKGRSDSYAPHSLYSSHSVSEELVFVLKALSSRRVRVTVTPSQQNPRLSSQLIYTTCNPILRSTLSWTSIHKL